MVMSPDPYEPPQTTALPASPGLWARFFALHPGRQSLFALTAAFGLWAVAAGLEKVGIQSGAVYIPVFIGVPLVLLFGGIAGVRGVFVRGSVGAKLGSLAMTFVHFGGLFLGFVSMFARGRQIRRFGQVVLPKVGAGGAWSTKKIEGLPEEARETADQWRENGRTEHASVAAFALLSSELMALGAPPELLRAANEDALDEIRHTEMCFSLARALDGRAESPGPFPEARRMPTLPLGRTHALASLAVESLVEGALHEGVSARVLAKLARRCEVAPIAAMLKEIARDEGRHAAHGWDVVLWCVEEGGRPVLQALEKVLQRLDPETHSARPAAAERGEWERLGIHGHALEQAEYTASVAAITARVRALQTPAIETRAA